MSVTRSKQSSDFGRKKVDPNEQASKYLDAERLQKVNLRMNNNGKKTISRFQHDNKQILYTDYGKYIATRNAIAEFKIIRNKAGKTRRVLETKDVGYLVNWLNEQWEKEYGYLIPVYDPDILKLYNDPVKKSPRSIFLSKKYYKKMATYGHNWSKEMPSMLVNKIKSILTETFYDYFTRETFDFDLEEKFKEAKWLTHIITGSNSGYPYNVPQDKNWMFNVIAPRTIKLLKLFAKGGEKAVNWSKLPFMMGSRTERGLSQRLVAMAPAVEKPVGALINTLIDENLLELPVPMPRVFGSFDEMAKDFLNISGVYVAKDFEGYDTSIMIALLRVLAEWFMSLNNTFGLLVAFELYLMIHSSLAVSENMIFWLRSLPSGIGTTQFIGSIIHMIADIASGLYGYFKKVTYQSDDTLGKGDITKREAEECFSWIEDNLFMKISPLGKKSLIGDIGLILQKIIWDEKGIYFGHEQRAHTNRYLRERRMNTDDELAGRLGIDLTNKKEKGNLLSIQGARSLLGNISSLGIDAPTLPKVLFNTFGAKATSYNEKIFKIAMNALKQWEEDSHKLPMQNDWVDGFYTEMIPQYGWNKVSANLTFESINNVLHNYGRKVDFGIPVHA